MPATSHAASRALGPGPELDASQHRILEILTSSEVNEVLGYDPDPEAIVEELTGAGDDTSWFGVVAIANRLWAHYAQPRTRPSAAGDFSFQLDRDLDGDVETYTVAVYLGHDAGLWLSTSAAAKVLSHQLDQPAGVSGLRKAVAAGEVIDGDFQRVRSHAKRLGLIPEHGQTSPPARPA